VIVPVGNAAVDGVPCPPAAGGFADAAPAPTFTAKLNGPENGVELVTSPPAPPPPPKFAPPAPPPPTTTYSTDVDGTQVGNDAKVPELVKV
jgi:hypothetical protein